MADTERRALHLSVAVADDDSLFCHRAGKRFGGEIGGQSDRRYGWRLRAKWCDVAQLPVGLITDLRDPVLHARGHSTMPCPPCFHPLAPDRLELHFERVEKGKCRRARSLVATRVRVHLDDVEIDPSVAVAIRLIDEGRRSNCK